MTHWLWRIDNWLHEHDRTVRWFCNFVDWLIRRGARD